MHTLVMAWIETCIALEGLRKAGGFKADSLEAMDSLFTGARRFYLLASRRKVGCKVRILNSPSWNIVKGKEPDNINSHISILSLIPN